MKGLDIRQVTEDLTGRKIKIEGNIATLEKENKYYATKDLYSQLNYTNELLTVCNQIIEIGKTCEEIESVFGPCEESYEMKKSIPLLEENLKALLVEGRSYPDTAIIEIRPAAGGDEASMFAMDLLKMYQLYSASQGWKTEITSLNMASKQVSTELKLSSKHDSLKLVVLQVKGKECFKKLFLESGVHRVQRIPETEANGRIHTSTITVAVLEREEASKIEVEEKDLRIDVFRASGAGGQHVNTTESAVRITHIPTGVVVQCQDERSQHENKEKAMKNLRRQIYEQTRNEKKKERDEIRQEQIGRGDRSEKIKTYNFAENRITDHRYNITVYDLKNIIKGDLESLLQSSYAAYQADLLAKQFG
jgi:peptide chain release factor 1